MKTIVTQVAGIEKVVNVRAATGGADEEDIGSVHQERAGGSAERRARRDGRDFEALAESIDGVKKARALGGRHPDFPGVEVPGAITVLVVADSDALPPLPSAELIRSVCGAFDRIRLITTEVHVSAPRFMEVRVEARLLADPQAAFDRVSQEARDRLNAFLSPMARDFGENVSPAAIYAQLFGAASTARRCGRSRICSSMSMAFRTKLASRSKSLQTPSSIPVTISSSFGPIRTRVGTMNGTSWLLGSGYPWHSGNPAAERGEDSSPVIANQRDGLSLAALPAGPLGLESPDGSLGRLALPRGVAVDGTTVLRLSDDRGRVLRYDPVRQRFVALREVGADGLPADAPDHAWLEPRRFKRAANIAAQAGLVYVADPDAHRVQVFELETLALLRLHDRLKEPVDVVAGRMGVYILDRGAGRVYRATASSDTLTLVVDMPAMSGRWDRIVSARANGPEDPEERVYVRDSGSKPPVLVMFSLSNAGAVTAESGRFGNTAAVRDRVGTWDVIADGRGEIVLPARLQDPCGLHRPREAHQRAWMVADTVYVIDTRARTVTVQLPDGRVRRRFGPYDAAGAPVKGDAATSWAPVELVEVDGCVFILDERHQAVHSHRPGAELLTKRFAAPAEHEMHWRRIAHDGRGCLLLWDGSAKCAERVSQRGDALAAVAITPAVWSDRTIPPSSAPRSRSAPDVVPTFARQATWTSRWLDSDIYNCQWHAIEMTLLLPPGARVRVRTRTSNERESDAEVEANAASVGALGSWRDTTPLVGPSQPDESQKQPQQVDLLVPSGPGQYLQLQVELSGDGIRTPVVRSLRVRFPRESLLQYLPAIYSQPDDQREFLDRFLSIAQATWSSIEREVETFERFLDPDSVPSDAMAYLAGWLDVRLEGTWDAEQNRKLLQAMPTLRDKWGTTEGVVAWLRVYLATLGRVTVEDFERAGIPGIVESFVERRRLMLNRGDTARLSAAEGLWSASVERRFQLGVFEREGEVELVSDRHPETDLFRHYAHSFRVFVPATWVRTAADEALIRRAIDLQKPAHTTYRARAGGAPIPDRRPVHARPRHRDRRAGASVSGVRDRGHRTGEPALPAAGIRHHARLRGRQRRHVMKCDEDSADGGCQDVMQERIRYLTGRHMTARDFRDADAYHRSFRHLHNRILHGWGIACGLDVVLHPNADCRRDRVVVRCGLRDRLLRQGDCRPQGSRHGAYPVGRTPEGGTGQACNGRIAALRTPPLPQVPRRPTPRRPPSSTARRRARTRRWNSGVFERATNCAGAGCGPTNLRVRVGHPRGLPAQRRGRPL